MSTSRYYPFLGMAFVSFLLIANVQGPKLFNFGPFILPVSIFIYPLTYVIAVAITEVYGFKAARKVIWFAFLMNLVMALSFQLAICVQPMEAWLHQEAYAQILGTSSRSVAASLIAYFISEFLNAYLIAKWKVKHEGKRFWFRAILGMSIAEAIGTFIVITVTFFGAITLQTWWVLLLGYYSFKVSYAILIFPILSKVVKHIKMKDQIDVFDRDTNFNPFVRSV